MQTDAVLNPLSLKQERLLLALLTAINFTHVMDYMIVMPLGARLMETLAITPAQFGNFVAAYSLAAAVSGFLGGFILDRFERKHALLWLYTGFMIATLACGMSTNYPFLLAARFAAGAFGGVAGSVVYSMVSDVIPPERRGRAMGMVMSAFPLASIMGIPTALWLTTLFGWQSPFLLLGGLSLLVLVLCLRTLPHVAKHPNDEGSIERMKAILSHPVHLQAFGLSGVLVFAGGCVIPFMASAMVANAGLTEHQLTFTYLFGGAATLLSTRLVGICADRFDKVRVIGVATLLAASSAILITHMSHVSLALVMISTTFFFVGMASRFPPTMALITNAVEARYRAGFMSVNSAVQQAANSLASYCAGYLLVRGSQGEIEGYTRVGYLSAAFMIFTYLMARRLGKLSPKAARPAGHQEPILSETT